MGSFSIWHWLIVLAIVMLVFGTKKLRNVGADLGGAVRGFKEGMKEDSSDELAGTAGTPRAMDAKLIGGVITENSERAVTR